MAWHGYFAAYQHSEVIIASERLFEEMPAARNEIQVNKSLTYLRKSENKIENFT